MPTSTVFITLVALCLVSFLVGRQRSRIVATAAGGMQSLHSLPKHYGYMTALWAGLPAMLVLIFWVALEGSAIRGLIVAEFPAEIRALSENEIGLYYNQMVSFAVSGGDASMLEPTQVAAADFYNELLVSSGKLKLLLVVVVAVLGGALTVLRISPVLRARNSVESTFTWILFGCSSIAVLTTLGIVLSVLFEALRFFQTIPVQEFLFGLKWSPQMAIRLDQVGASGSFGFVPLLVGTLLISAVAMLIAVPVGLMSAIYLSEYATRRFRAVTKPVLEILAGVPTVVYGFFAALTVAPFIRNLGESLGLTVASESALAAGLVMGIMIIPFVMSLSDDIINAVPDSMREASLGMGATMSETIRKVLLPAALPGIVGGILLAVSRAIGETMIVVMAAGLSAKLTANPLEAVTTITVQIVTLLVGDQEFDSPKTLAAFALGLVLFFVTLLLNIIALYVVRRYREQYE
ncbi:phosphate ABC transporter permease subunit PstC [Halioglobus japonicus]|uniref:Phosphate transport system permease protein n=2 Tax=Halioglobus TaxID=1217416 RepID=A0AAP8MFF0_9GAMM|nr:phosphate ABC transporter permease subunit PstC [Halioglobus japonicus]AQA18827.1 phosphate ABC transporter permease subunit PstC [Halioglobus japonicus]PLW86861.1 phosphate ABC transporter permease subunit PstC [Halioglobus japonicus]GHD23667.1 phosphate transport system permease protein [Halioglobus japonicus]